MQRIKRDDIVLVVTGKERGKQGQVHLVIPKHKRVIVQGLNMVKRHQSATPTNPGGIVEKLPHRLNVRAEAGHLEAATAARPPQRDPGDLLRRLARRGDVGVEPAMLPEQRLEPIVLLGTERSRPGQPAARGGGPSAETQAARPVDAVQHCIVVQALQPQLQQEPVGEENLRPINPR